LAEHKGEPALSYRAGLEQLETMAERGAAEADVRAVAEKVVQTATPFGPEMQLQATHEVAQKLLEAEKLAPVALTYARRAERMLNEADTPTRQAAILKTLLAVAEKAEPKGDRKELMARLAKLDEALDK